MRDFVRGPCLGPIDTASELPVIAASAKHVVGILGPLRSEIVEVESPETGTALPDSYRSAPALTSA